MTLAAGSESVFDAILGGFGASNRFLAQFPAGFGLQIDFWRNPRRVLGFKHVFDAIPGGFRASNRFLVRNPAGIVKCLAPVPAGTSGRANAIRPYMYPANLAGVPDAQTWLASLMPPAKFAGVRRRPLHLPHTQIFNVYEEQQTTQHNADDGARSADRSAELAAPQATR